MPNTNERGLFRFTWDCRRMGTLEGLFVAPVAAVEDLIGEHVYFGEVLGKHSEIAGTIERGDISRLTITDDSIRRILIGFGYDADATRASLIGYNPVDYHEEVEE